MDPATATALAAATYACKFGFVALSLASLGILLKESWKSAEKIESRQKAKYVWNYANRN